MFAGWRLENGCRYRGVVLVLDYERLRTRAPGFDNLIAVPQEEVVFDDHITMPLQTAQRESLARFSDVDPEKIPPIALPFCGDEPLELPAKKRSEYITIDRLIKDGGTDDCAGCELLNSRHTRACRDRFNRLIRADKPLPVAIKHPPPEAEGVALKESEPSAIAPGDRIGEDSEGICAPDSDDLSEYAPTEPLPEEDVSEMHGMPSQVQANAKHLSRIRRLEADLPGIGVMIEYACSSNSLLGQELPQYGLKVIRLSKDVLDLSNIEHVAQVANQLNALHGADVWFALPCEPWSNLQELNLHKLGDSFAIDLSKRQQESSSMVDLALQIGEYVISHHGRFVWEWPAYCKGWRLPQLEEFQSSIPWLHNEHARKTKQINQEALGSCNQ